MEVFTAASHHDILVLVLQIAVLLFAARACGEIAQRLGQPSVIGEITAGILIGPSLLTGLLPFVHHWLMPQTPVQGYLLEVISLIGAMFLMLITGLETDLTLIRRHLTTAIGASTGGLTLLLSTGFLLGLYLPDHLLAHPDKRLVFALFVAAALAVSAIPVIAKVLLDLDLMRRDIGQTIIAAGMVDDTIAWILLSVIIGLASGKAVTIASISHAIINVLAFILFSFTIGRWFVKKTLDFVQDEVTSPHRLLTLVVILAFAWGALSQAIGLEAIFGAFIMGILFGQVPRLPKSVIHTLESLTLGIFSPIFFTVAGLKINLRHLIAEPNLILISLATILVAILGKLIGCYIGARWLAKSNHWTAVAFGSALNARGAMGIIIASIGLSLGILSQNMFAIIVLMSIITSLIAPAALRWALKNIQPEEQELKRLRQEELTKGSLVAHIHRVLLPVRQRETDQAPTQTIEARLLEIMSAQTSLSLTLLNIAPPGHRTAGLAFLNRLKTRFSQTELLPKVVESTNPIRTILDEAAKDYDLLVLGASERLHGAESLFSPIVDHLVRLAPCLTIVVKGSPTVSDWAPRRILVPTNGGQAAKSAAELSFAFATPGQTEVIILHVIDREQQSAPHLQGANPDTPNKQQATAVQIVDSLCQLGHTAGIQTTPVIHTAPNPESVILEMAHLNHLDLIILGTNLRPGSTRLFLGPRVETILDQAPCPVIVLNLA